MTETVSATCAGAVPSAAPRRAALLVEDDPAIRSLLALVLEGLGLEARVTDSAREGARWAMSDDFALAVLDQTVKEGSGLWVARALRARTERTPIVFLSGSWTEEQRKEAGDIARAVLLDKPVNIPAFEGIVRMLLADGPRKNPRKRSGPSSACVV